MKKQVSVSELKVHALKLMSDLQESKFDEILVTKKGASIAKITRFKPKSIIGCMAGMAEIVGDIVSPIDVEWNVLKDDYDHNLTPKTKRGKR